jgi:hypothetical protein
MQSLTYQRFAPVLGRRTNPWDEVEVELPNQLSILEIC